jgi:hypothetical protein
MRRITLRVRAEPSRLLIGIWPLHKHRTETTYRPQVSSPFHRMLRVSPITDTYSDIQHPVTRGVVLCTMFSQNLVMANVFS